MSLSHSVAAAHMFDPDVQMYSSGSMRTGENRMRLVCFRGQESGNVDPKKNSHTAVHAEEPGGQDQDTLGLRPEISRQGNHEPERLQYITQDLRDVASASNQARRTSSLLTRQVLWRKCKVDEVPCFHYSQNAAIINILMTNRRKLCRFCGRFSSLYPGRRNAV